MSSNQSKAEALLKKIQDGTKVIDWDDFKSNGASVSYLKRGSEGGTQFIVRLNLYNNTMHNSIEIIKRGSKLATGYANTNTINGALGLKGIAQAKMMVDDGAQVRWVKSNRQPRSFYINYIYQEYNGGRWHTGMRLGGKTYYPELHLHRKSHKESDKIRFKQKGSRKWEPGEWGANTAAFKNAFKHTQNPERPPNRAMIEYDDHYDDVASGIHKYGLCSCHSAN